MNTIICTNTGCPIYQNWFKEVPKSKIDIIQYEDHKYSCLALEALYDRETGITESSELKKLLPKEKKDCDILNNLNNQMEILGFNNV